MRYFSHRVGRIICCDSTGMKAISSATANGSSRSESRPLEDNVEKKSKTRKRSISRRSFLGSTISKGAAPANLDAFRALTGSTATGVNPDLIGHRLTNLTQLTVDTSWWTRYRDDRHNPDFNPNHVFPQAVPTLGVNQHTAIPRTDADTSDPNFLQAIANTAGFPLPTIEKRGHRPFPPPAPKATPVEGLRILLSIGPTETM